MMTIEDRLDEATQAVKRQVERIPLRPADVLRRRNHRRRAATAVSALALMVGMIGGTAFLLADATDLPAATDAAATQEDSTPPTTGAPAEALYDSDAALAWRASVAEALADNGWQREIALSYETPTPVTGGGSVTAVVRDDADRLVLVVDLQAFAPGEYRDDPIWQKEVAGSNSPGQVLPEGTLFVADTETEMRLVLLVTEEGLLTLKAEATPSDPLPPADSLESLARVLAPAIAAVVEPLVEPTSGETSGG